MPPQKRSTMVTIMVTQAPSTRNTNLKTLKGRVYECDVEWTWVHLFERMANVSVDPSRYVVTSSGKQPVRADDKVRSLIGQFQKVLKKYSVNIKEGSGRIPPPEPIPSAATQRKNIPEAAGTGNTGARPGKKNNASVSPSVSAGSSATVPIPNGSRNSRSLPKRPANPTNGHHSQNASYPEDDVNRFPLRDPFGGLLIDDDDNASQVTTDSQESQDDLIELGLANEDYKPKVVQRFMKNISNPQTIRIREELRKVMNDGKWNKVAMRIPHTCNFLIEVFRFQPVN